MHRADATRRLLAAQAHDHITRLEVQTAGVVEGDLLSIANDRHREVTGFGPRRTTDLFWLRLTLDHLEAFAGDDQIGDHVDRPGEPDARIPGEARGARRLLRVARPHGGALVVSSRIQMATVRVMWPLLSQ